MFTQMKVRRESDGTIYSESQTIELSFHLIMNKPLRNPVLNRCGASLLLLLRLYCFRSLPFHSAQVPLPDSPAIEAKAQAMLAKLTLEEKIQLLGGVDSMYTQAVPSIDLPRFKMSDASAGVRTWGPTTAYAGGVALAATWDREFAQSLGEALGRDARARGVNFPSGAGSKHCALAH